MTSWTEVIDSDWGMYFFADEWSPVGEVPNEDGDVAAPAFLTGFLGMRASWAAVVLCGTKSGPVRLTVEVLDQAPARPAFDEWSEIIEVGWQSRSGEVQFRTWAGLPITTVALLPLGWWRLQAHARGRDEGHAESSYDVGLTKPPREEHLLQFWPGENTGDVVRQTRDRRGQALRGELR